MEMKCVVSLGRNTPVDGAAPLGIKALSHLAVKAIPHLGVMALSLTYMAGGVPERSPAHFPVTFIPQAANTARDKMVCKALLMANKGSKVSF